MSASASAFIPSEAKNICNHLEIHPEKEKKR